VVAYGDQQHHQPIIFDRGDDAVVANPVAPETLPVAGQRLSARRIDRLRSRSFNESRRQA
jgi:hypothetical protein